MASFITLSSTLNPNISTSTQIFESPKTPVVQTMKELVAEKAEEAGVSKDLALRIAFCESTYRQFADDGKPLRGIHNPGDVGLFQINETYHIKQSIKLGYNIESTEGNIDYAMYLLKKSGAQPWSASKPCWGAVALKVAQAQEQV